MQNKRTVENLLMYLAALTEPILLIEHGNRFEQQLSRVGKEYHRANLSQPFDASARVCKSVIYVSPGAPSKSVLLTVSGGFPDGTPMLLIIAEVQQALARQTEVITSLFESGFRLTALPGHSGQLKRAFSQVAAETADSQWQSRTMYMTASQAIRFRAYREGDEIQILALFKDVFGVRRSLAHWNWKYRDNPWGRGQISLLETATGSLAGHFAVYPLPMHVEGKGESFTTIHGGDVMTSPAVRGVGVGPTSALSQMTTHLYNRFLCGNYSWGFGFNTGRARIMGKRYVGYTYLPEVIVQSLAIAGLLTAKRPWSMYCARRLDQASVEFDELFDRVSGDYRLLIERKSRYINWRYLSCPDKDYQLYGVWNDGQLCGWGVFIGTRRGLFWGDALFQINDAEPATAVLLEQVVKDHELENGTINAWFSPVPEWWISTLERMGFVRKKEPDALAPMIMRFDSRFSLEEIEQSFYYTKGDSDLF